MIFRRFITLCQMRVDPFLCACAVNQCHDKEYCAEVIIHSLPFNMVCELLNMNIKLNTQMELKITNFVSFQVLRD
jgi:hypothetical protein